MSGGLARHLVVASLDLHLGSRLRAHLAPGEVLVWVGAPALGRYLAGHGVHGAGGLGLGALALSFGQEALTKPAFGPDDPAARLAAAVFAAVAGVAAAWLLAAAARAFARGQVLVYGLTDRRALVLVEGPAPRLVAPGPAAIGAVQVVPAGRAHDVWFTDDPDLRALMPMGGPGRPALPARGGFAGVVLDDAGRARLAAALASLPAGG